jgi:hypothetical protein
MTAVEQLEKEIYKWLDGRVYIPTSFFEQAKAIEKEQNILIYRRGYIDGVGETQLTNSVIKNK